MLQSEQSITFGEDCTFIISRFSFLVVHVSLSDNDKGFFNRALVSCACIICIFGIVDIIGIIGIIACRLSGAHPQARSLVRLI